ncbi:T9SS type A sorting domain-containing protein [Psychroserpens sp. XS_ASV72]|uniref:T9SS type A sorting domain-containing protein n=1 Tax=Psychroserpens sp. XS_ASV72 TaxID=3241293 RepID=UPI0035154F71
MRNTIIFLMLSLSLVVSTYGASFVEENKPLLLESENKLSIYPNPVYDGKVYIVSDQPSQKNIEIFDVLGKPVLSAVLLGKELDVRKLPPGVYILKIEEGKISTTRKLIIK